MECVEIDPQLAIIYIFKIYVYIYMNNKVVKNNYTPYLNYFLDPSCIKTSNVEV